MGKGTVLITGASGFVATHIVREFLEHGYNVVGTVRSQKTAERVKETHSKYAEQLSFSIVEDVASPGAFDEAVKNVDGVVHTASPFVMHVKDNEKDLLEPAIHGTRGILQSIKKNNPKVKRVVITSSFASVVDLNKGLRPGYSYTEADWNPISRKEAASASDASVAYCASKALAERAAFDFVETEKPNFSISTVLPPMIYGPAEQVVTDLSKLNTSSADIYRLMNGREKEVPDTQFWACADVRDVAVAHLLAYESESAANRRFFIGHSYSYQMVADILRDMPEIRDRVPEGKPGSGMGADVYKVDSSRIQKELSLKYGYTLEQTIQDMARQFLALERKTGQA